MRMIAVPAISVLAASNLLVAQQIQPPTTVPAGVSRHVESVRLRL